MREKAPAMRLRVPDVTIELDDQIQGRYSLDLATACGDFLVRRSDDAFAYQLAVVVDDAAQGITSVVRGVDLLPSTPQQIYLQGLLGLPRPVYAHVPLFVAERDRRLSKRNRDAALDALMERFGSARAIIGHIAWVVGIVEEECEATPEELLDSFDLEKFRERMDDPIQVRWH